ncbi:hypothetical protein GXW78_16965 [Roseomonas terrae]|uniref:Uncharacterized protein n=1 Tax=Neoroseomonas terrae TaxID=424799 RepID=A0ABS5EK22_9PROT|nr:hypothetical protein [Neoroseomonas terrae]MBR0651367.1 hypothetical protein [Neoroseomonas terrae]
MSAASNTPRRWTDAERQQLLDLLREGVGGYQHVAYRLGRNVEDCQAEAAVLRQRGWTASGASKRRGTPPPSRECLTCRDPFAPEGRFYFLCQRCRRAASSGWRRDPDEQAKAA